MKKYVALSAVPVSAAALFAIVSAQPVAAESWQHGQHLPQVNTSYQHENGEWRAEHSNYTDESTVTATHVSEQSDTQNTYTNQHGNQNYTKEHSATKTEAEQPARNWEQHEHPEHKISEQPHESFSDAKHDQNWQHDTSHDKHNNSDNWKQDHNKQQEWSKHDEYAKSDWKHEDHKQHAWSEHQNQAKHDDNQHKSHGVVDQQAAWITKSDACYQEDKQVLHDYKKAGDWSHDGKHQDHYMHDEHARKKQYDHAKQAEWRASDDCEVKTNYPYQAHHKQEAQHDAKVSYHKSEYKQHVTHQSAKQIHYTYEHTKATAMQVTYHASSNNDRKYDHKQVNKHHDNWNKDAWNNAMQSHRSSWGQQVSYSLASYEYEHVKASYQYAQAELHSNRYVRSSDDCWQPRKDRCFVS